MPIKVDPSELVPAAPLKVDPSGLVPESEPSFVESWPRTAAFFQGGERALRRALNFSFGMRSLPWGSENPVGDAAQARYEKEVAPIIEKHPGFGLAGDIVGQTAPMLLGGLGEAPAAISKLPLAGRLLARAGLAAGLGAAQGAVFSPPGERASGAAWGAATGPVAEAAGGLVRAVGQRALPAADMAAAHMIGMDPGAAVHTFGGPGVTAEDAMRRAGRAVREVPGAASVGPKLGDRALLIKSVNQEAAKGLNDTISQLEARGARVKKGDIIDALRDIRDSRFAKPGTQDTTREMTAGYNLMDELIARVRGSQDLSTGSPFSNFVNYKRVLQAQGVSDVESAEFKDMAKKAVNEAGTALRKLTEDAAEQADPALGAKFKEFNSIIERHTPLERSAIEMEKRIVGKPPAEPHYAYSPESFAVRMATAPLVGPVVRGSAPFRIGANARIVDPMNRLIPKGMGSTAGRALLTDMLRRKKEEE